MRHSPYALRTASDALKERVLQHMTQSNVMHIQAALNASDANHRAAKNLIGFYPVCLSIYYFARNVID